MGKHMIIYAKRPFPGYAKTRLGKSIGEEEAAGLYARLLYRCLLELIELTRDGVTIELSLASSADIPYFRLAFPEFLVRAQTDGNLGQRFTKSFQDAFDRGAEAVVVIGTDIPGLDRSIIQLAFQALREKDVVMGPDTDGGYYLIGTRKKNAILFDGIKWSSEFVFQQTLDLINAQQFAVEFLSALSDVDTETDFRRWYSGLTISS